MNNQTIFDQFKLNGKTAIVTGGIGLLGKGFVRTLAEAGASVIVADLNQPAAQAYAQELQQQGYQVHGLGVNVTDKNSVEQLIQDTLNLCGSVDILVNSAALDPKFDPEKQGEQANNAFENYPLDMWNAALNVNLTGPFLMSQAAATQMRKQESGVIINICSIYGLTGPDQRLYEKEGQPPSFKPVFYSVTKAGIVGLTKYLATYFAGTNIRVNTLTPGGVYNGHDEEFSSKYGQRAVLGRMADKDEMNAGLLYLASDASKYVTGTNLIIDGGWTAW